eukprot:Blabericola_migrator_1__730@NODE_1182_length_5200_cov_33_557763_g804_i0_p2_GENE_NODE_1182_length_5200_cov_33_557763_g804_i0NODE_1182_length_5200_cov_33_557763_g804_i0_p2_ORF_typecomplete_len122_score18_37_NODE_1182_length_5200_cov_33_557763_g804_i023282693
MVNQLQRKLLRWKGSSWPLQTKEEQTVNAIRGVHPPGGEQQDEEDTEEETQPVGRIMTAQSRDLILYGSVTNVDLDFILDTGSPVSWLKETAHAITTCRASEAPRHLSQTDESFQRTTQKS